MKTISPRQLTVALLIVTGCCVATYTRRAVIQASDSESVTWGATDPTWSSDGSKLAFSLFGSIWQVSAQGGPAEQITTSSGYHAHPAWSPKGDQIAFIRGTPPAISNRPNIPGDLMLVDVSTGVERQLRTPSNVSGTLAWSPDGTKIACPLTSPDGAVVHEIDVATGNVRPLQSLPQRFRDNFTPVSTWVDLARNPKSNEILFSEQRRGSPQIWSMPAGAISNRYNADAAVR